SFAKLKFASAFGIILISSTFMYFSIVILGFGHDLLTPSISFMTASCCASVHFIIFITSLFAASRVTVHSPPIAARLQLLHFLLSVSATSPQYPLITSAHIYGVVSLPEIITGTLILLPYNSASAESARCTSLASDSLA